MPRDKVEDLDQMNPAANEASLGTQLKDLRDQFVALLQKLDADVGVTDTDYEATLTPVDTLS